MKLKQSGHQVASGYLVNKQGLPGGGGLLILQSKNYEAAKSVIEEDPMIIAGLVSWSLKEWIPVSGNLLN